MTASIASIARTAGAAAIAFVFAFPNISDIKNIANSHISRVKATNILSIKF